MLYGSACCQSWRAKRFHANAKHVGVGKHAFPSLCLMPYSSPAPCFLDAPPPPRRIPVARTLRVAFILFRLQRLLAFNFNACCTLASQKLNASLFSILFPAARLSLGSLIPPPLPYFPLVLIISHLNMAQKFQPALFWTVQIGVD